MSSTSLVGTGGVATSLQLSMIGPVTNLAAANFKLPESHPFVICNETDTAIVLEVIPAASQTGAFVTKRFQPGDNAYLVREIKLTALANSLVWGY